jgi:hypothetical protein
LRIDANMSFDAKHFLVSVITLLASRVSVLHALDIDYHRLLPEITSSYEQSPDLCNRAIYVCSIHKLIEYMGTDNIRPNLGKMPLICINRLAIFYCKTTIFFT